MKSDYTPSYVAFLDILGFKAFVKNYGFDQIKNIFEHIGLDQKSAFVAMTRAVNKEDWRLQRYNKALKQCKIRIMSDSIVIAASSRYKESLAVVLDLCNNIQENLYECKVPVFLRGAIAEGEFYSSEQVMFGQGLIDAYLAQENISVFPRIIIADKVLDKGVPFVDDLGGYGYEGLPQDKDGYHYINTLGHWLLLGNCGIPIRDGEKYQRLYRYIRSVLSGYPENRLRQKYLWLQSELERVADTAEAARLEYLILGQR